MRGQVISLGNAGGAAGCTTIERDRRRMIAGHFQKMSANRVETMVLGEPRVGIQRRQQFQTLRRTVYHRSRNRVIEHHHGIVRGAFQQLIERENLRPVGVLGSSRFVMNGGDRGLELIAPIEPFDNAVVSSAMPSEISA